MGDCVKDICDAKELLASGFKTYVSSGFDSVNTHEAGQVTDMIKDLAEAEYYCTVTKAMNEKSEDFDPEGMMGYRPMSVRMGYKPMVDQEPYVEKYLAGGDTSDYGRMYDEWKKAKRHYTDTHSEADKLKMSNATRKHVDNAIVSVKEMWMEADPELKSTIKSELASLMSTM